MITSADIVCDHWSVDQLREHLMELTGIREALEATGNTSRFSTRLQIESLRREESKLQEKINALERGSKSNTKRGA